MDQVLEEELQGADLAVPGSGFHIEDVLQPPLDVGIALELTERLDIGMVLMKVDDKAVQDAALVDHRAGAQRWAPSSQVTLSGLLERDVH
jgi:hypothetical protein